MLDKKHRTAQIHPQCRLPRGNIQLTDRGMRLDSGIVDQGIEPAPSVVDIADRPPDGELVGDISAETHDPLRPTMFADKLGDGGIRSILKPI
jgi:hypothetical protein